jgi:hypothetical protein
VKCAEYQPAEEPFMIYFTFEVQMLMYIHSYLSKNEVIGLLGGKSYDTTEVIGKTQVARRILIVNKFYPCTSCINQPIKRLKNCEISDSE